jgi:nucleoside-diphosphate-sugar epimerase
MVRRGAPMARAGLGAVEWRQADVTDARAAEDAARGAAVVYDCANPAQYHRWDELLPPLKRGVREAAAQVGARLVVLDCLYMYGRPDRSPFDEDTSMRPCSRKGELRAQLARELADAQARGAVRATTGRASDFFGPGMHLSLFGRGGPRLLTGKPVDALGDPDQPHGYSYGLDVARGLAALGLHPSADGKVWHLPLAWTGTTRALVAVVGAALGVRGTVRAVPDWVLRAMGVVVPPMGAVAEMTYQWKLPYVIDDRRIREAFGVAPTPAAQAVAETAAWIRAQGAARAA